MAGTRIGARRVGRFMSGAALAVAALAALLVLAPAADRLGALRDRLRLDDGHVRQGVARARRRRAGRRAARSATSSPTRRRPATTWSRTASRGSGRTTPGSASSAPRATRTRSPTPGRSGSTRPTQARVRVGVPYAGHALSALGRRDVRMFVIALPALLIAGFSLSRLWRQLGVEAQRRAAEASGVSRAVLALLAVLAAATAGIATSGADFTAQSTSPTTMTTAADFNTVAVLARRRGHAADRQRRAVGHRVVEPRHRQRASSSTRPAGTTDWVDVCTDTTLRLRLHLEHDDDRRRQLRRARLRHRHRRLHARLASRRRAWSTTTRSASRSTTRAR